MAALVEVVDGVSLEELAATANHAHEMVERTAQEMFGWAVAAGEALVVAKARVPRGGWYGWVQDNFRGSHWTAAMYMRLSAHRTEIPAGLSIRAAREYVRGLPVVASAPSAEAVEAVRLVREDGLSKRDAAGVLGVAPAQVYRWLDPQRYLASQRALKARRREEREALAVVVREREIKRAVRKAGAATAEAWAMAERFQGVLGQAEREAGSVEERAALRAAGVHYRQMRDLIVRALGVS